MMLISKKRQEICRWKFIESNACKVTRNPQRIRPYEMYTVCFLIFIIPWKYKLLTFCAKSLSKPFKNHSQARRLSLNLRSSYLKRFKSSFAVSFFVRLSFAIFNNKCSQIQKTLFLIDSLFKVWWGLKHKTFQELTFRNLLFSRFARKKKHQFTPPPHAALVWEKFSNFVLQKLNILHINATWLKTISAKVRCKKSL